MHNPLATPFNLSLDKRRKLGGALCEYLDDIQAAHGPYFNNIRNQLRRYDAEPRTKIKNTPWPNAPLSRDTEILTKTGWRRVDEVGVGDIALTREDESGELSWQPVLARPEIYAKNLLHFKSKSVDQLVTPEHTMVTKYRFGGIRRTPASRRFTHPNNHLIPLTGECFKGNNPDLLFGLPSGDVMELIGWYIAEGSSNRLINGEKGGSLFIAQSRTANPKKCKQLENLFYRLDISWAYCRNSYTLHARSLSQDLLKCLREQGSCNEKFIPSFVLELHSDLIWRMLLGLMAGDGHVRFRPDRNYNTFCYYTTSKRLAGEVQALYALCGKRASIRERNVVGQMSGTGFGTAKHIGYEVQIGHKKWAKVSATTREVVSYDDTAYCVTVKNHAIYVRRNGIASWTGNSNVIVPVIRSAADAMTARMFSTLQGHRRRQWIAKSQNETFAKQYLGSIVEFLNYAAISEIDTFWPVIDWIQESVILGCSVTQVIYEEQERYLLLPGSKRGPRTPEPVILRRGPKIVHWPAAQILWTPGQELRNADFIATQSVMSWSDIVRLMHHDEGFVKDDLDIVKGRTSSGDPGMEIRDEQGRRAGIDDSFNLRGSGPYDVRTIWLDYTILRALNQDPDDYRVHLDSADKEGIALPIVVELLPDAKLALRVRPNPYTNLGGTNFFDLYYRRRTGYPRGIGVAKILEGMQSGISTMLNQGIDAVTLANAAPFMTTNPRLAKRPMTPGQGMLVDAMGDVARLDLSKMIQPEIALMNLMQVYGERVSGVNDPMLGRESRSGGHPSPATNYLGQMEQSREMGSIPIRNMREQYSRIGETIASLYQLFDTDPEGRLTRVFGEADATRIQAWLFPTDATIAGNMDFDVFTLSETENPETEMKKALVIQQATQQYMAASMQILQMLESPQIGPLQKQAAVKALEVLGKTHQQFLEAADFDEAQEAIIELQNRGVENAGALDQFRGLINQLGQQGSAGGQGAAPVGPVPPMAQAPPNGTGQPVLGVPPGQLQ